MAWGSGNLGGSITDLMGLITVNYVSESALTIGYRAGTSGSFVAYNCPKKDYGDTQRVYYVKDNGQYQLTATKNSQTASSIISINVNNRWSNVTLAYELYLIQNGNRLVTWAANDIKYVNSSSYANAAPSVNTSTSGMVILTQPRVYGTESGKSGSYMTTNNVDLSSYNRLRFKYDIITEGTYNTDIESIVVPFINNGGPPAYQNNANKNIEIRNFAGVTKTNQIAILQWNKAATPFGSVRVGIGITNNNVGIGTTLKIRDVWAYTENT